MRLDDLPIILKSSLVLCLYIIIPTIFRRKNSCYSWASIFAFAFGIFFWFHTVRWKILSFYVFMMILTFCLPPPYYFFWPLILKFIDLYFAMLAPRICHERWKKRGYRIAEESYEQIPRWYITFLKSLYRLPSLWLF